MISFSRHRETESAVITANDIRRNFLTNSNRNSKTSLWELFCSLKLTLFLLAALAASSAVGALIPQDTINPGYAVRVFAVLGLSDMYHSWLFVALLCLFSLNLICCSIKRLPQRLAQMRKPTFVLDETTRQSCPYRGEIVLSSSSDAALDALSEFLRKEFAAPIVSELGSERHLFARRNSWRSLAAYAVHVSVLIILAGALTSSLFGVSGFVRISEGESVNSFVSSRSDKDIPLGFELRCDSFVMTTYPNGAPKEFKSVLTALDKEQASTERSAVAVTVNHPMTHRKFTFYQSGYGKEYHLSLTKRGETLSKRVVVRDGETTKLDDGSHIYALRGTENVAQFAPGLSGPAVAIGIVRDGQPPQIMEILANYPEFNARHDGKTVFGYDGTKAFTILRVTKDPGAWIVWLGFALMLAGLYGTFFVSHKRIWIIVTEESANIYGKSEGGSQAAFARQFVRLREKLEKLEV